VVFLVLWVIAIVLALAHVSIARLCGRPLERATIFLLYQMTVALGLVGFIAFIGHVLMPAEIATRIGWPTHRNFQFELGAACLGFAVGSFLAPWIRDRYYWLGIALGPSIFIALAGINHLRDAIAGNLAPYNVGTAAPDLLIPATVARLLYRVFRLSPADGMPNRDADRMLLEAPVWPASAVAAGPLTPRHLGSGLAPAAGVLAVRQARGGLCANRGEDVAGRGRNGKTPPTNFP
jgi:hypothetical protein